MQESKSQSQICNLKNEKDYEDLLVPAEGGRYTVLVWTSICGFGVLLFTLERYDGINSLNEMNWNKTYSIWFAQEKKNHFVRE